MKQFKNLVALVLALVMVFSVVGFAFAENTSGDENNQNGEQTNTNTNTLNPNYTSGEGALVNNVNKDGSVSVSGLQNGDSVNFYQIVKWVDGTGWAWISEAYETALATAAVEVNGTGATAPALTSIVGQRTTTNNGTTYTPGDISKENAAILARAAASAGLTAHNQTATSGTATYSNPPAGLYYAQVVPGDASYLYNTIFVGADYHNNDSNTIAADTAVLGVAPNAIAKKEQITLTKDSYPDSDSDNVKYDHEIGEIIPFKIESKVPAFAKGYINPFYEITDTLEDGLVLSDAQGTALTDETIAANITVTIADVEGTAPTDWTITKVGNGFKVALTSDGLAKVAAKGVAKTITVTYKAKLTTLENATVTEKTNEATVKFSNKPTDAHSYSLLEDKTRHYTFSLDANLLGRTGDNYVTDELIKIGLNPDGTPLTQKYEYRSDTTWTELSPLQGAVFTLYTDAAKQNVFGTYTSDATGRLNITGLDAAKTYYLEETTAPTGFIKDNRTFQITITANYDTIAAGTYDRTIGEDTVTVYYDSYKVLKDYTVAVYDGTNTTNSVYTIEKTGETHTQVVDKAKYKEVTGVTGPFAGDNVTPISNTLGTELPSTGGIGTTIFYVAGIVLVLGAAAIIIARRKAEQN